MKNRPDNYYMVDKLRVDVIAIKKKVDNLSSLFNKQTDYFDDRMHKMLAQLDLVNNLEKRLTLSSAAIELVP
jgi:hypothetical protein